MLWGNYNGTPVRTISILDGIKTKISDSKIVYDKGCDLVEDKVTQSFFDQLSFDGKRIQSDLLNNPEKRKSCYDCSDYQSDKNDNCRSTRVCIRGWRFSALFEAEFTPKSIGRTGVQGGATGYFELMVDGKTIQTYNNWRTLSSRIPLKWKQVKIQNWDQIRSNERLAGKYRTGFWQRGGCGLHQTDLKKKKKKLRGIETVVFVGGLSGNLEGEEMPVNYPGFQRRRPHQYRSSCCAA